MSSALFDVLTTLKCRSSATARARQPISRAELARQMGMRRGAVSRLVAELLDAKLVFEGAKAENPRGRKPRQLYVETRRRCVVAVDVSASHTAILVTDLLGRPLLEVSEIPVQPRAQPLVDELAQNFPNPFNPETAITFSVPKTGWVDLAIYDVVGRKVASLVSRTMEAGLAANWPAARAMIPPDPAFDSALEKAARMLSLILLPSLQHAVQLQFKTLALRRMAATALALRLYELDHGERPPTLTPEALSGFAAGPIGRP